MIGTCTFAHVHVNVHNFKNSCFHVFTILTISQFHNFIISPSHFTFYINVNVNVNVNVSFSLNVNVNVNVNVIVNIHIHVNIHINI